VPKKELYQGAATFGSYFSGWERWKGDEPRQGGTHFLAGKLDHQGEKVGGGGLEHLSQSCLILYKLGVTLSHIDQ